MRVGFAGTSAFAASALRAIADAGHEVPIVLTQPDRPRGRGLRLGESPVKGLAVARGLRTCQPASLKSVEEREAVVAVDLDVLVVAAYGLILPPPILSWPRVGCLNIHASLLPRWRGAAPIQRALLAGDRETGITIMQMDRGLDTGPMIERVRVPIAPRDTAGALEERLATVGARAIVAVLARLAAGEPLVAQAQPDDGATYAAKIRGTDAAIDWTADAETIDRQVRAFDPSPGAFTTLGGQLIKIWRAEATAAEPLKPALTGEWIATERDAVVVACGSGALRIAELQPAGGKRMSAAAFVAGRDLLPGSRFDAVAA